jgi:hypothetical protein
VLRCCSQPTLSWEELSWILNNFPVLPSGEMARGRLPTAKDVLAKVGVMPPFTRKSIEDNNNLPESPAF